MSVRRPHIAYPPQPALQISKLRTPAGLITQDAQPSSTRTSDLVPSDDFAFSISSSRIAMASCHSRRLLMPLPRKKLRSPIAASDIACEIDTGLLLLASARKDIGQPYDQHVNVTRTSSNIRISTDWLSASAGICMCVGWNFGNGCWCAAASLIITALNWSHLVACAAVGKSKHAATINSFWIICIQLLPFSVLGIRSGQFILQDFALLRIRRRLPSNSGPLLEAKAMHE